MRDCAAIAKPTLQTWTLGSFLACILIVTCQPATAAAVTDTLEIPDTGWRLWLDREAAWKDDQLFLPSEVQLAALPVNPPTGGWDVLDSSRGIAVTLPSTVEQHYWGQFGFRPYKNEYYFERSDDKVLNGNVRGFLVVRQSRSAQRERVARRSCSMSEGAAESRSLSEPPTGWL
jgi:hypothetical protein